MDFAQLNRSSQGEQRFTDRAILAAWVAALLVHSALWLAPARASDLMAVIRPMAFTALPLAAVNSESRGIWKNPSAPANYCKASSACGERLT